METVMMWESLLAKILFKLISMERRRQTSLRLEVRYTGKVHTQRHTYMRVHTHTPHTHFWGKEASGSIALD